MDIVLIGIGVSLHMDLMNFAKITKRIVFIRLKSVLFSLGKAVVIMEIAVIFCIVKQAKLLLRQKNIRGKILDFFLRN